MGARSEVVVLTCPEPIDPENWMTELETAVVSERCISISIPGKGNFNDTGHRTERGRRIFLRDDR